MSDLRIHGIRRIYRPASKKRIPRGLSYDETIDYWLAQAVRDGDCLFVPKAPNSEGYIQCTHGGRAFLLHRAVLARKLGRPLCPGEFALHSCHRRGCCESDHLRAGTKLDNARDKVEAGRCNALRGEVHPDAKLTEAEVLTIRRRYAAGGVSQSALAREYGLSQPSIGKIVRRETWTHI